MSHILQDKTTKESAQQARRHPGRLGRAQGAPSPPGATCPPTPASHLCSQDPVRGCHWPQASAQVLRGEEPYLDENTYKESLV